jgi:CubicO group peptidase (beta-lactamase class C family)
MASDCGTSSTTSADGRIAHIHQLALTGAVPVWTNESMLDLVRTLPGLQDEPGTVFSYSSVGYICLAIAAERAAGEPIPTIAQRRLFAPLGMASTRFWTGPSVCPSTVTAHSATRWPPCFAPQDDATTAL